MPGSHLKVWIAHFRANISLNIGSLVQNAIGGYIYSTWFNICGWHTYVESLLRRYLRNQVPDTTCFIPGYMLILAWYLLVLPPVYSTWHPNPINVSPLRLPALSPEANTISYQTKGFPGQYHMTIPLVLCQPASLKIPGQPNNAFLKQNFYVG